MHLTQSVNDEIRSNDQYRVGYPHMQQFRNLQQWLGIRLFYYIILFNKMFFWSTVTVLLFSLIVVAAVIDISTDVLCFFHVKAPTFEVKFVFHISIHSIFTGSERDLNT